MWKQKNEPNDLYKSSPYTLYYIKCTIRSSDIVPGHSAGDGRTVAGGSGVCEGGKTHGYNIIYYTAQIHPTRLSRSLVRVPKKNIQITFHSIASRAVHINIIIYTYYRYLCRDNALYGVIHLTGLTHFCSEKNIFLQSY